MRNSRPSEDSVHILWRWNSERLKFWWSCPLLVFFNHLVYRSVPVSIQIHVHYLYGILKNYFSKIINTGSPTLTDGQVIDFKFRNYSIIRNDSTKDNIFTTIFLRWLWWPIILSEIISEGVSGSCDNSFFDTVLQPIRIWT